MSMLKDVLAAAANGWSPQDVKEVIGMLEEKTPEPSDTGAEQQPQPEVPTGNEERTPAEPAVSAAQTDNMDVLNNRITELENALKEAQAQNLNASHEPAPEQTPEEILAGYLETL